jgi:PKD repeat protein/C1A family cysteine protease
LRGTGDIMLQKSVLLILVAGTLLFVSGSVASCVADENGIRDPGPELVPLNPDYLAYLNRSVILSGDGYATGFVPPECRISDPAARPGDLVLAEELPSSYDLRSQNRVTSVKNQNPWGTCWAFSAIASLESNLMPDENLDFSEKNMVNRNYKGTTPDSGGDFYNAGGYLTAQLGPVSEQTDPYPAGTWNYTSPAGPVEKNIYEIHWLPDKNSSSDLNAIKNSVMNYGALSTTYYENKAWNTTFNSYFYPNATTINHGVVIAGWDDTFSRLNFTSPPPGDGAFLIKNSWGTGFGDGGYGWISYHDANLGKYNTMYFGSDSSGYTDIYQHDLAGPNTAAQWGNLTDVWEASRYTVQNTGSLSAIGFYTTDNPTRYNLTVYRNPSSGPVNGEVVYTANGTYPIAGYHVINLTPPAEFVKSDICSIVINLMNDDYYKILPLQYPPYIKGSYNPAIYPGDSYYSLDGTTWQDTRSMFPTTYNSTTCIKGYMDSSSSAPKANFTVNQTYGPAPLTVQFIDVSTGRPTSWAWAFGDGQTSVVQHPVNTYSAAGVYHVTLQVSNVFGSDTKTVPSFITATSPSSPPVANFTVNQTYGPAPLTVQFIDFSTGRPTSWAWAFGDGQTSVVQHPVNTYSAAGVYHVTLQVSNVFGSDTKMVPNLITATSPSSPPVANFAVNQTNGPAPLTVQFIDMSTGNPTSWGWAFGDGQTSIVQHPVHTYPIAGLFNVSLQASNALGSDTKTVPGFINVSSTSSPPVANFTVNKTSGPVPLTVQFTDTSTGNPTSWFWSFGDGRNSYNQHPVHTYDSAGLYTVNLSAGNGAGYSTMSAPGLINATVPVSPPVANFTVNQTAGPAPLTVRFTDMSTGSPTSWGWAFGDGNNATVQHPVHTYSATGLFNVTLQVANAFGSDTKTAPDFINVTGTSSPPVANFTVNRTSGPVPLTVQFTDTSTGNPSWWWWFFGDGGSSDSQHPVHTYGSTGLYTINFTAGNGAGNSTKSAPGLINVTGPVSPPVANFTVNRTSGPVPLTVQFTDTSTGTPTDWLWSFGDSTSSYNQHPVHTYGSAGQYTVNLTVKNDGGYNKKTSPGLINATGPASPPVANFTVNRTSGPVPLTVQFTDTSTGNPSWWWWFFGDGGSSDSQHPVHTYGSAGLYTVSFTAKNAAGNSTMSVPGLINATGPASPPVANFTVNRTSGSVPLTVRFTDTSTGNPTSWLWFFGEGNSSDSQHPVHTYGSAGLYTVNFTVNNAAGNSTMSIPGLINATGPVSPPVANFTVNRTSGPVPLTVQFTDTSTGNPTSWQWFFGEGGASTLQHPVHTYHAAGLYSVDFIAKNVGGSSRKNVTDLISVTGQQLYTITAVAGEGGSISPSGNVSVLHGANQTFSINPFLNYNVSGVLVDGVNQGALRSYTFWNITADHRILANFTWTVREYKINSTSDRYTISSPPGVVTYPEGSNTTYLTQAKPGSDLLNVTVDTRRYGPNGTWTFTNITDDHTISTSGRFTPGQVHVLFAINQTWGQAPLAVQCTDQSVGDPTSFYWQFGDGSASTSQNPVHVYQTPGVYTITLRATSNLTGGVGVWNNAVTVTEGIVPKPTPAPSPEIIIVAFNATPDSGTAPLEVSFHDQSVGNPVAWSWSFGDGQVSTEQHPTHRYTAPGTYTVTLLAQNVRYSGSLAKPGCVVVH